MKKEFLLGNQAIALGAIEAGVKVATAYPGTPSTEIIETIAKLAKKFNIHVEWSVNEKVALEVAIGASYSGVRAIAAMKHVGVNVALDPLMTSAYTGVVGGLVLVSADDPSMHSSQNEQDNRLIARFAKIFCLEPRDARTCKEYVKEAFEISEKFQIPVMLRTTTRVSHAKGDVEINLENLEIGKQRGEFIKNPSRFVVIPANARKLHKKLNEKLKAMEEYSNESGLNSMSLKSEVGIITSGVAISYVREVLQEKELKDISLLEIGVTHPLPRKLIRKFLEHCERVLVVEELEPYIEDYAKTFNLCEVHGKDFIPREYELNVNIVKKAIYDFLGLKSEEKSIGISLDLPIRPPVLCAGCPHRALFYALKKVTKEKIYCGDIGCYTLGINPPLKTIDTCLCMGASITKACGMFHAGVKEKPIALIGDSTFLHTGIPGLLNAVYNNANITVIILDNKTTAMTGHQPHPGVGFTATLEETSRVEIEEICKACGVKFIKKVKPFELEETTKVLKEAIEYEGVAVVIAEEPCALIARKLGLWKTPYYVDKEKCKGWLCQACRACIALLSCPAITWSEGKAEIIEELCTGCGVCAELCPNEAIKVKEDDKQGR